ncbi:Uncharacterized protein Fot_34972 [Forsythia ovata]|uniref:Uncharacterized protein n=1 Tax=Forsythia ovata TaxID=205694 RepID=A0ABD1SK74_9LAMI
MKQLSIAVEEEIKSKKKIGVMLQIKGTFILLTGGAFDGDFDIPIFTDPCDVDIIDPFNDVTFEDPHKTLNFPSVATTQYVISSLIKNDEWDCGTPLATNAEGLMSNVADHDSYLVMTRGVVVGPRLFGKLDVLDLTLRSRVATFKSVYLKVLHALHRTTTEKKYSKKAVQTRPWKYEKQTTSRPLAA